MCTQVRDKATGELVQNLTSAAPRFLVSRTHSDVSDQIIDKNIKLCDQSMEVCDQSMEACEQIMDLVQSLTSAAPRYLVSRTHSDASDQIIKVCVTKFLMRVTKLSKCEWPNYLSVCPNSQISIDMCDQIIEVGGQIIDACYQIMAKLNRHSGQ